MLATLPSNAETLTLHSSTFLVEMNHQLVFWWIFLKCKEEKLQCVQDTNSAIEGCLSSRPWNRSFKDWPNKQLENSLRMSFPVLRGNYLKRGNTWCCHPSAPALSWICCLKLFKMAPCPCSTYNEDSKCKTSWWRTMCVHLLYFSSQGTHLSFVIRFIVQDLCPPLKHSQNLYLFHRIYIIYI